MRSTVRGLVVGGFIVAVGVAFVLPALKARSGTEPVQIVSPMVNEIAVTDWDTLLRPDKGDPAEFSGLLAASIPLDEARLDDASARSLAASAESWLAAYAAHEPSLVLRLMAEAGIDRPSSWTGPIESKRGFDVSLSLFRLVSFDPNQTRVVALRPGEFHPFIDVPHRGVTRHNARAFLGSPDEIERLPRREILFSGLVRTTTGKGIPVTLGIDFAQDPRSGRWIPIRATWYGLPDEIHGRPPIL